MQLYKVEYLMVLDSEEIFCKSVEFFNSLLQCDDYIEIFGKNIRFKENSYGYEVQFVEISNGNRFFHLKLSCDDSSLLEDFKTLLKSVRKILTKVSGEPPEILWNDIGTHLSCEAYPILHEIENILRKLITKFMLATVGITWTTATVPQEIIHSLREKKDIRPQNYLYKTDFIQLSTFLFKEYSTANSEELIKALEKANDFSKLSFDAFKKMVPQSNWDRYFSPVVDCESNYLKTRWEKLYKLRCMIAHNRFIDESDFDEIERITGEIKPKLLKAIDKLDEIHVSPEQKEEVAENIASNVNERYGEFIVRFKTLQDVLLRLYNLVHEEEPIRNRDNVQFSKAVVRALSSESILPQSAYPDYKKLNGIRNVVVHRVDVCLNEEELLDALFEINNLEKDAISAIKQFKFEHER